MQEPPSGARCPVCTGGFIGVAVYKTYKGRHYHTDCLRCTGCGASVGTRSNPAVDFEAQVRHVDGDGPRRNFLTPTPSSMMKVYCEPCAERCAGCDRPLAGGFLDLNGRKFHEGCFKCMRCSKPLPAGEVYMLDDMPACLKCCEEVHEMRQTESNP